MEIQGLKIKIKVSFIIWSVITLREKKLKYLDAWALWNTPIQTWNQLESLPH